jgi:hypothetical protein
MKTAVCACMIICVVEISQCQETQKSSLNTGIPASPFIGNIAPVPEGYGIGMSAGYPIFGDYRMPVMGRFQLSLAGALELGYSNEGYVGNAVGMTRPADSWGAKLQILRQQEMLPSVTLWARGTIGWQNEDLGAYDLWASIPSFYSYGVVGARYEFMSTTAGVAVERTFGDKLSVDFSLGMQQLQSRNLWIFISPAPVMGNGYHAVSGDRSYLLDASIDVTYRVLPNLTLIAQAGTLPYFSVNPYALRLDVGRAYVGTIGFRYALPIPVSLDVYIRKQSMFNGHADTQFRLGISIELPF